MLDFDRKKMREAFGTELAGKTAIVKRIAKERKMMNDLAQFSASIDADIAALTDLKLKYVLTAFRQSPGDDPAESGADTTTTTP